MKRLPILLWILASCRSATTNVTADLSVVMNGGDLAVKPADDLSVKPAVDLAVNLGVDLAVNLGVDLAMNLSADLAMTPVVDFSVAPDFSVTPDFAVTPAVDMKLPTDDLVVAGAIPDPGTGNGVDVNFGDVEPNDTPGTATPLGVAATGDVYVWVSHNTGGGSDANDYFVFKTGSPAGTFTLAMFGICWDGGITGVDATLWKVAGGQEVLPPIQTWISTTPCTPPGTPPALEADTEYLLGLAFHGASGSYLA